MCGRYKRRTGKQDIEEYFHVNGQLPELPILPDDDIRPTTVQPIVRENRDTGERDLVAARWLCTGLAQAARAVPSHDVQRTRRGHRKGWHVETGLCLTLLSRAR